MARKEDLATLLAEFDESAALRLVAQRLEAGEDSMAIVDECNRGMRIIGERYQEGTYYISGLIMAGDLLRQIIEILAPWTTGERSVGTMVICTVQGDIHDIGKGIAANLLTAHGLRVVDLGADVPPKRIADEVEAQRPDVVGLSGTLAGFEVMKRSVEAIRERTASSGSYIPVILGGGSVTRKVCEYAGADRWTTDAVEGVRLVRELLSKKSGNPPSKG